MATEIGPDTGGDGPGGDDDEVAGLLARLAPGRPPIFVAPGWRLWALSFDFADSMLMVEGVKGFLMPGDVEMLCRLAAWLPHGGTYVEIGSFMGLSSALVASTLIAFGNHEARFYSTARRLPKNLARGEGLL